MTKTKWNIKKKFSALMIVLLAIGSLSSLPVPVYASNSITVLPSTAYVGMFRTIFIYVSASDTAAGIWKTEVWPDASTIPTGIWMDFDPSYVLLSGSIESRILVYAGPAASLGTYSITIKAGWTTIIGQHWETQTTFTLQVKAVSERYWAQNPSLLLQNPPNPTPADKWHPGVRQWNVDTGENWEVSNTENLYVNWNVSGRVDMMAKAAVCNNIDQIAHCIQGLPEGVYQPPPVTLNPQKTQINLKGAVTDIFTTSPDHPLSWTGIKWDLYATSTKDGRTLYIELYFVRTGGNLLWELMPPKGFRVHPGHNEVLKVYSDHDNAMLDITEPSMNFNEAFVSIVTLGPTTWFSIDVTGIFGFVAYEYAVFFQEVWDSSRSINDYNLTQVALCLEANNNGGSVTPQCSISLEDFELKGSYLADINLDGKIDNTDVTTVNNALDSALGDSGYLPNADLNLDRVIDSTDLAMVTNYVGKTFPAPWLTVSSSAGGTTSPAPGTYLYDYSSSVTVTAIPNLGYVFNYWLLDGSAYYQNPITVTMNSDHSLEAYFNIPTLSISALTSYPGDVDGWCEDTSGWTVTCGSLTTTTDKKMGSYSLQLVNNFFVPGTIPTIFWGGMYRTFSSISGNVYQKIGLWANISCVFGMRLWLLAPDFDNYFAYGKLPTKLLEGTWELIEVPTGSEAEELGFWSKNGSANWDNLQGIYIGCSCLTFITGVCIDGLHFSKEGGGTTNPAPGTYTYEYGSSVNVTATPDPSCSFKYWLLDGAKVYGNQVTVTMNTNHMLEAHFNRPPNAPSTPSGLTYGCVGASYTYSTSTSDPDGDGVRYQFYWGDGSYTLTGWYTSGATASASHSWGSTGYKSVKVRAQDSYGVWSDWSSILTVYISGGGGGDIPCPTLFAWNGSAWVDYGVIDIHNPDGEDVIREVPIIKGDVGINGYKAKFRLREGWEGLNFSESVIDQVKLYAIGNDGKRYLCPLITATHSTLGKVLPQLLASDDIKAQMLLLETIDLTFTVPYPTSQIQGYVFVIEGCNMYKV